MKVENSAVELGSLQATEQAPKSNARMGHKHAPACDRVELSSFAQAYTADFGRVDQLQASYQSGTYRVSSNLVAGGIISYMMN